MIIFLYGQDTYRLKQKLDEIIKHYQEVYPKGLGLKVLDLKEKNFQDFKTQAQSISIFNEKRLLVLKSAFSNSEFKEKFLAESNKFLKSNNVILFFEEGEIKKGDTLFKFLKKEAKCQEFRPLGKVKLRNFIEKEAQKKGVKITSSAVTQLVKFIGNDLWRMENEIEKLVIFKSKRDDRRLPTITEDDIKLLVFPGLKSNIFSTIDAIALKRKEKAMRLIESHFQEGVSPAYLLSMINFQFRNIILVKDSIKRGKVVSEILKKTGLHPFVVEKSLYQGRSFSMTELKNIYQKILQEDLYIKTGRVDPKMGLALLVTEI